VSPDAKTALDTARTTHELNLPIACAVMLATARTCGATLWTQDAGFEGIPGVHYVARGGIAWGTARRRIGTRGRRYPPLPILIGR
jgi:hypothetical protein